MIVGFVDFFKTFKKDNQERATPKEAPSHWIKCPSCNALMYYKEVIAQYHTCPKCNFHMRIGLKDRISLICDEGSFVEFDKELAPTDPLNFVDKKSYKKRIEEYEKKCGRPSSIVSGECTINGISAQIVLFDFNFPNKQSRHYVACAAHNFKCAGVKVRISFLKSGGFSRLIRRSLCQGFTTLFSTGSRPSRFSLGFLTVRFKHLRLFKGAEPVVPDLAGNRLLDQQLLR